MAPADPTGMHVEVVYSPSAAQVDCVQLTLPAGACLGDAVRVSGLCERHALDMDKLRTGIWGRMQPLQAVLRDRDRVELYRPLKVDPKEARRLRYKRSRKVAGA